MENEINDGVAFFAILGALSPEGIADFYEAMIAYTTPFSNIDHFYEEKGSIDDALDFLVKDHPWLATAIAEQLLKREPWDVRIEAFYLLRELCGGGGDVDRLFWETVIPMIIAANDSRYVNDVRDLIDEHPGYEEFVRRLGYSEQLDAMLHWVDNPEDKPAS